MSFSLLVQRKERKEKTPREKPFSSFTSCFSGIAELTCLQHTQTAAILFPKNSRSPGAFQRVVKWHMMSPFFTAFPQLVFYIFLPFLYFLSVFMVFLTVSLFTSLI